MRFGMIGLVLVCYSFAMLSTAQAAETKPLRTNIVLLNVQNDKSVVSGDEALVCTVPSLKSAGPDNKFFLDVERTRVLLQLTGAVRNVDMELMTFSAPFAPRRDANGKTYVTDDDVIDVITYWMALKRTKGEYVPPSKDEIYERTAAALSGLSMPQFHDIDTRSLAQAFETVCDADEYVNDAWLKLMQEKVGRISQGKTRLVRGKTPGSELYLIRGTTYLEVVINPRAARAAAGAKPVWISPFMARY